MSGFKFPESQAVETFDFDGTPIVYVIGGDCITRVKYVDGKLTVLSIDFERVAQEHRKKREEVWTAQKEGKS